MRTERKYYSFTKFSIKPRWMWFAFQIHGMMVTFQLKKTPGLIHYKIWTKGLTEYYTLSCWENHEAMLQFRNGGAHRKAMKDHRKLGVSKSVGWFSAYAPYPEECYDRLAYEHQTPAKA